MSSAIPYRPEIDGLRAIAVAAVVLFHLQLGCPGGYVGVDVFLVISGFLITSLIWTRLEDGTFTFAEFWERRARRIVPALAAVTIATLAAGWFMLLPADFKSLGKDAASQALFAANIRYWLDTGYFAAAADEKPLLHTWSLAIEEQFYVLMPLALWVVFRARAAKKRELAIALLLGCLVASFALSAYGVVHYSSSTFYLLPTRAWELLLGGVLSFMPAAHERLRARAGRELAELFGLALIAWAAVAYTPKTPFPGIAALMPTGGAAILIWAASQKRGEASTTVETLLASRPVVLVGLMSYSIYLWHWPF